jgi:hypothetical protein
MVSLITRSEFVQQLESDEYTATLVDFLLGKNLSRNNYISTSNANEISKYAFYALQKDDQVLFLKLYDDIMRRKPKPESEWMHNDALLFALTLGVRKFNVNKDWLEEVLKIRLEHSQDDGKLVAQTYIDITKDNLKNTNNYQPLMIVMKYFLAIPFGDIEYVNLVYQELVQKIFPYSKVAFLNLICLKAMDAILLSKGLIDLKRQKIIDEFIVKFNYRITQIATLFWIIIFVLVLSSSILFLIFYLNIGSQQAEILNKILTSLPFLGFGGLNVPAFIYRKKIIDFFRKPFFKYYGYMLEENLQQ